MVRLGFKLLSIPSVLMDLSKYMKKSGKAYKMPEDKACTTCSKEITKEDTPRHLFYAGFCSEKCKEKYVETDEAPGRY